MKRANRLLILTSAFSLAANALAIVGHLAKIGPLAGWSPNRGLLAALTFVSVAYALAVWSVLAWRWAQARRRRRRGGRAATFVLNGLAAFPLLTLWLYLLLSETFFAAATATEQWMLALALAWTTTPFVALGLMVVGETLGPLFSRTTRK